MAATKERYQNPAVGDTVRLRNFFYNANNLADVSSVDKIEIYYLDPQARTAVNPDGRTLVQTIETADVTHEATGTYLASAFLEHPNYVIGNYLDIWSFYVNDTETIQTVTNMFQVFPSLWYSTPIPVVYDFNFHFQPNKLRKGSKQYLIMEIIPNLPRSSDLQKYYENLAIVSDLSFYMEKACDDCNPDETEMIFEDEDVTYREKRFGYYQLDTEDLDCGLYNIWFKMEFGGNTFLSDKMQLLIYS
jgi:hypothetical protein